MPSLDEHLHRRIKLSGKVNIPTEDMQVSFEKTAEEIGTSFFGETKKGRKI
jgi:hypothetical protein